MRRVARTAWAWMALACGVSLAIPAAGCADQVKQRARAPAADPGFEDEQMGGPGAAQHRMVSVVRVDGSGQRVPGAGVDVSMRRLREGMPGDDSAPVVVKSIDVKANEQGVADLGMVDPPKPREQDHIVARYAGVEWPLADGQNMPVATVWDVTEDQAPLSIDMRVVVSPRDQGFLVEHLYTLSANGSRAVDLRGAGLRIPLLVPAIFGVPFEAGYLPDRPDENTLHTELQPPIDDVKGASFKAENGVLVLRTTISPDSPVQVTVRAFIKYADETEHTFAFRMPPLDVTGLVFFVERPEKVGLRAALRLPADQTVQSMPGGEQLVFIPTTTPKAGDAVVLDLVGSPERHGLVRPVATALAGGLAALVTLTFLARRRREVPPAS